MISLLAGIKDDPLTAAFGCAAIVPVAVWAVAVVTWMVMGEMDLLFGLVAISCAAVLGIVAMWPPEPVYAPLSLGSLLTLMIVFPVVKRQLDRRALVVIEIEQIDKAYEMLAEKPDNANSMFLLAERLYHRGLVTHAIGIGERALQNMPKDAFIQEHRALQKWRHQTRNQSSQDSVPCLDCGFKNGVQAVFCDRCGARYLATYARGKWLGGKLALRLTAAWVAAVVALVGVPLALQAQIDAVAIAVLVVLQLSVAALLVWQAFLRREGRA